jgi:hypothetical protein
MKTGRGLRSFMIRNDRRRGLSSFVINYLRRLPSRVIVKKSSAIVEIRASLKAQ